MVCVVRWDMKNNDLASDLRARPPHIFDLGIDWFCHRIAAAEGIALTPELDAQVASWPAENLYITYKWLLAVWRTWRAGGDIDAIEKPACVKGLQLPRSENPFAKTVMV